MTNNFFDLVKEGFFNPFNNRNKRVNYDLLCLINNKLSLDNLQVTKEDIVEWIVDYVENCPIELFDDETDNLENGVRELGFAKVRYFVKCGWLIEDYEGINVTYQMDENGIKLLAAMENAIKDEDKALEFSGYVYNIYNGLYHFTYDHSVDIVEQAYNASKELNSMLRGLNVNIKKFLQKLITENEAMPKEILDTIFYDYQKKVVLKAFKNFREKDNPAKYKIYIEERINGLLNKNIDKMVENYLKVKYSNSFSTNYYDEAIAFFKDRLNYIKNQFEDIEDYIQMLDRRNTKYISTAQSRLNFLLNEEANTEGRIIECLKSIGRVEEDFFEDSYLDLFMGTNLDENSLYKPISRRNKIKTEPVIEFDEINAEELEKLTNELFKENELTVFNIDKYVEQCLGEAKRIMASGIQMNCFNDILKLFLVQVYSSSPVIKYQIQYLEDEFVSLGYQMKDFIIERKD